VILCICGLDLGAREICYPHRVFGHHGDFAVAEKENVTGVFQDRRNVRSDKVFAIANTDYHRRPSRAEMTVSGSSAESIDSAKIPRSSPTVWRTDCSKSISLLEVLFNQVRYDFGVGLGDEVMIFLAQVVF